MTDLVVRDISGPTGTFTAICDFSSQRAWFRDNRGKVRYWEIKDGKVKSDCSAIQRKTDKRRKPDIQDKITQIWAMLHEPGVKLAK